MLLEDELAAQLLDDGWNVKTLKGREPGDDEQPYLQVSVGFGNRPPKITLVTSRGKNPLNEAECEIIDWIDIKQVDLIIRPYSWNVNDKSGIKAYLKTLYVVVDEDFLEQKYADVPELEQLPARAGRTYDYVDAEVVEERRAIES